MSQPRVKPTKITQNQINQLEQLAEHFDKMQLHKHFVSLGLKGSIYTLPYKKAGLLITSLFQSLGERTDERT